MKKYSITEESITHNGFVLWRIQRIATQEKGGWIQSEKNLSQLGEAWVADNAKVYGEACVSDDACVSGNAEIFGSTQVRGASQVYGEAKVYEEAIVEGSAHVYEQAEVCGMAFIKGDSIIGSNQRIVEREHTWEDINSIESLKIVFSGGQREEKLYSNGRHQVGIHVNLIAKDKEGKIIILSEDEVFKHMEFVNIVNKPYGKDFKVSAKPGEYALPLVRNTGEKASKVSLGVFYLSTTKDFVNENVCVRCVVNQKVNDFGQAVNNKVEYTTAKENNNGNVTPNYIVLSVLHQRIFRDEDIYVQKIELKKADNYNSILTKHYVQFSNTAMATLHHAECKEDFLFHFTYDGNYRAYATTTDSRIKANFTAKYTAYFDAKGKKTYVVTSTNHDMPGLCVWTYRIWHGRLLKKRKNNELMLISLFDIYGNEAKVVVKALNDAKLSFKIA